MISGRESGLEGYEEGSCLRKPFRCVLGFHKWLGGDAERSAGACWVCGVVCVVWCGQDDDAHDMLG